MRILILVDRANWCFSNRANALKRYAPPDMQITVLASEEVYAGYIAWPSYDLVFLLNTSVIDNLRRQFRLTGVDVPIIASHNSGLFRREDMLRKAVDCAEYVIINNYATYADLLARSHGRRNFCNISNGVDLSMFYVERPIEDRPHVALWAGSKEKAEDPGDVKGWKRVIEPLATRFEADANPETLGCHCIVVEAQGKAHTPAEMRAFYNGGSYLICPSVSEGTPNIVLEAAACGCIPVCGPVGNVPELFTPGVDWIMPKPSATTIEGVPLAMADDYWEAMLAAKDRREEMSAAALKAIRAWDWSIRSAWFYRVFREVAAGHCPEPFTWLDSAAVAAPAA